jgi:hypothetical protein
LKILLSGMLAGVPGQGGATWAALQYLEGLRELGHEVLLVEEVPSGTLADGGAVPRYFRSLPLRRGGAALLERRSERTLGLSLAELERFAGQADLLLNLSGTLRNQRLLQPIEVRAFLDLDPCFNQIWHEQGHDLSLEAHTHFVTVGTRVGAPDCAVPTCGREWILTLPPVCLGQWPCRADAPRYDAFTTVGHWRSYGSVERDGVRYGQRAHSLRRIIELPRRASARFQLALGIHPEERADLQALQDNGWGLLDPASVASTPQLYRELVAGSKAELCVAKSGYVDSRCGWFSDRSACYLASGRPVVAQDTGFGDAIPAGEGLLGFSTLEQAAEAVEEVEAHYERHRLAARELAQEHLDARKVLSELLQRLGEPG